MQIEPVSLFGRGAPPILARMFWPPPRFDAEMEAEYRADSLRRWIVARQVAVVLIAGFWISYFGWDWFHAYRNEDFRPTLGNILILRGIGTLIVASSPQAAQESAYHSEYGRADRSMTVSPSRSQRGHAIGASGSSRQPWISWNAIRVSSAVSAGWPSDAIQ